MNILPGPGTGLDLLLLTAGGASATVPIAPAGEQFTSFEAAIGLVSLGKVTRNRARASVETPVEGEFASHPATNRLRELDQFPICTLPAQGNESMITDGEAETPPHVDERPKSADVCFASTAAENRSTRPEGQALVHNSEESSIPDAPPMTVGEASQSPVATGLLMNASAIKQDVSQAQQNVDYGVHKQWDSRQSSDADQVQIAIESAGHHYAVVVPHAAVQHLRESIIATVKPHAVVRIQKQSEDVKLSEHRERPEVMGDRFINLGGRSQASLTDQVTTEPSVSDVLYVPAPRHIDEIAVDVGRHDHKADEIVVELSIPDLGVLEIEVTRDGEATEVSLLADPALNQLIRDHLPELAAALSASGIELSSLDVRQHDHEHHADCGDEILVAPSLGSHDDDSQTEHAASRTGLSRYRLMSITA